METVTFRNTAPASNAGTDGDSGGQDSGPGLSAAEAKRQEINDKRQQRRVAQAQTDRMCAMHTARLANMESSRRVYYQDENGETARMDDVKRVTLVNESKSYVTKNCR